MICAMIAPALPEPAEMPCAVERYCKATDQPDERRIRSRGDDNAHAGRENLARDDEGGRVRAKVLEEVGCGYDEEM